ncbi:MAG: hypothetical protein QME81_12085 [bacterium]|nr:hypothetical protein [bacterium]
MIGLLSTYVQASSTVKSNRTVNQPSNNPLPFYTLEERQKSILKENVQAGIKYYLGKKEEIVSKEIESFVSGSESYPSIEGQDFIPLSCQAGSARQAGSASPFENKPLSYLELQISLRLSEILNTVQAEHEEYTASISAFLSDSLQEGFFSGCQAGSAFRPPQEHEYQIKAGETINLVNQDTGEATTLSMDDSGNLKQGFGRMLEAETITLSSQDVLRLRGEGSQESYRIEVSRERDWIIEAESGSKGRDYYIDEVQHGLDVVNIINIETGAVSGFKVGCLEQYDRAILTGDDVTTLKVRPGDVIHIKSAGEHGDYQIEVPESGEWLVRPEKREGEDQSVFYRSKDLSEGDVINLKDAGTGEILSLQINREGSLAKLEKGSFKGGEMTTYEFSPNDKILLHTRAGKYYQAALLEGEGWQIKGLEVE